MSHARRALPCPAITLVMAILTFILTSALAAPAHAETVTVAPLADTTYTQVTQDGDNGVKTTLATCPARCDGNAQGQRDLAVSFAVAGLPSGATIDSARLELSAWQSLAAPTTLYEAAGTAGGTGLWSTRPTLGRALGTHPSIAAGTNAWDVTPAVTGNGTVTFDLQQAGLETRVYWASKEHANAALRPRLVIAYSVPSAPGWNLVWRDEFDTTSLDRTKWVARDTKVDYDLACITSRGQNVFVGGGVLTLRAQRERYACGGETRSYTTSYLDTRGLASFAYGRFETRAKSPNGPTNSRGLWPAFWMRPDDGGNGEIDVVELPGGSQYYKAATAAIFRDYTPTKQDFRSVFATGFPGDGFHTYTTEWEPGVIRWYIDGREIWRRDRTTTSWLEATFGKDASYNRKFNLRLNFQVGGWLGAPDAATAFPADFVVDYVRVWQR